MSTRTSVELTMPQMGDSVTEGTVLEWHKEVGERVEADEVVVEISTDKVDAEVPSPVAGVITEILAQPDEVVAVGAVLAIIEAGGEAPAGDAPRPGAEDEPGSGNGADPVGSAGETVDVTFPEMGDSVAEGTILEWHKEVGDSVEVDDGLVEISTDKVDAEVPSPVAGRITEILVKPDEVVPVGAVLCRIAAGAPAASGPAQPGAEPAAEKPAPPSPSGNGGQATPVARRMAAAGGLDVSSIQGTGPRGRVTKTDVLAAAEGNGGKAASAPAPPAGAESKAIRGPAGTLVRFMNESRSIPTATSFRTLEVGALDRRRRLLKAAGQKLSFTHLVAWAIVQAAKDMPVMGHGYAEVDGSPHRVTPATTSLGIAVDAPRKDGSRNLVVPVIADASEMSFKDFVARYDELVAGARDNELSPDAYAGANITLTNPGGIGTVASVPRLMPGQGTIVATGAIGYPAGFSATDQSRIAELGISKVMTMTSTYDHRIIQGAESGAFLKRIDELLQGEDGFYERVFEALGVEGERVEASSVDPVVTSSEPVPASIAPAVSADPDESLLQAVQAATSVVKAHRMHGHLAARVDPLGVVPLGDPALDPETVNLTPELMEAIPAHVLRIAVPGETFAEALPHLRETYCGSIAYEIEHIADHEQRVWLRQTVEWGEHRKPMSEGEKRQLLSRLSEVEALESYLHKAFLGKKQFSIEGLDALVPMLDEIIELAASAGSREVVLGMAHRGRLNVQAHTVGRPYEAILAEFEGESSLEVDTAQPEGGTGDVKYHYGASGTYKTRRSEKGITVTLSPNPSHLEYVNPVITGRARADQTSRKAREATVDFSLVLPVIIHGDAAFPGQGVVAETMNLQGLPGYSTGGHIHIIANNQLGFTTDPGDSRSTRYASDLAKGFDIPIIHVNADDVEACIAAVRLAFAFRDRFSRDALIDLVGYRRFGHNETDEPAYTQPVMYERIKKHPPVRAIYAERLAAEGVIPKEESEQIASERYQRLADAHAALKESMAAGPDTGEHELDRSQSPEPKTAVPAETLVTLNEQLLRVPDGFNIHRKLKPQLERRREALTATGEDALGIDWAQAEALAFASLLCQGVPIRLTGQDTERGTFSQRHMVLSDSSTGERVAPIQRLPNATAPFELHNSPLSEIACLGFEYGYSAQAPDALVIWEAQFGDFVNSAQVIIDQFIVSGLAKWGQTTRLTLLLPHGYEGSGPEHSSGRLERFLQLAAEGNIRVANCTTPAQYFHLLRRQALVKKARPLVVMTPKSLLRLPAAASRLEELSDSAFSFVLDDPAPAGPREEVTRLVLCSGKIYYDIQGHERRAEQRHVAIARCELLYPFPESQLRELMDSYPALREVVWVQEEPRNMGARSFMKPKLDAILPPGIEYRYVGRDWRASPGEGYAAAHRAEQARLVRAALAFS
ncbi:MAG TPA: multifunctional oxoglutarate decarboxylase/oxoglutarate dehydrogenase thiamine pyrophosphate-binding subunit/dihydrolipoyllysine-residue succinyltransferase subunit [Thermoleophilaceae bacterium]|nr:multifunctional oxoglutarate decarboxylase/oxoglutarate dehydrogenase thiamine pyrophosphate-binding subunit/dihydrolipoyllysine-residue succinyltransferase subunit [Thermoleophilaceae bacterium]